jgi:hypothetical protein
MVCATVREHSHETAAHPLRHHRSDIANKEIFEANASRFLLKNQKH